MNNECQRCGKCCMRWNEGTTRHLFESPKVWEIYEKHSYSWAIRGTQEQLDTLNEERKKYYHDPDWCEMLIKEGDIYCCLIHKLYGKDVKPLECVNFNESNCMSNNKE